MNTSCSCLPSKLKAICVNRGLLFDAYNCVHSLFRGFYYYVFYYFCRKRAE